MGQKHASANPRSVPSREVRPGAIVRLRNPEGRLCEGVIHHLNGYEEPYILPSDTGGEPFYAHPADIEEVLGFRPELVRGHADPEHASHGRYSNTARRNKPH